MSNKCLKPKKPSLIDFTRKYANNDENCIDFFMTIKWPDGFSCDHCGCKEYYLIRRINKRTNKYRYILECKNCHKQHSLLSGTIFQSCKLELYTLMLGLFLFFSDNKGKTAVSLSSELDINYKSAELLIRKCRVLMSLSNSDKQLYSKFLESDIFNIGTPSREKRGKSSDKQEVFSVLSTAQENRYPEFIKLCLINDYKGETFKSCIERVCKIDKDTLLNTDGEKGFNALKDIIQVNNVKIDYSDEEHRLEWLNTIIGNIKNNIMGIYHGVSKRDLPLFLNEQEYRFNHRYTGKNMINKIQKYIRVSFPVTHRMIVKILDEALPKFTSTC